LRGILVTNIPSCVLVTGVKRRSLCEFTPKTATDVQTILQLARKYGILNKRCKHVIEVISTGKRWGTDQSTTQASNLRIRMSEMRGIPLIDLVNGIVVIEPGVTQLQLSALLQKSGWYFPMTGSCVHTSIVGNTLDGGICTLGVRLQQVAGLRGVQWDDGTEVATGVLECTWHGHSNPRSGQEGLAGTESFASGIRGIVTQMAFQLHKLPKYLAIGIVMGGSPVQVAKVQELYDNGFLSWWQLRFQSMLGPVIMMAAKGRESQEMELKMFLVRKDLVENYVYFFECTNNIDAFKLDNNTIVLNGDSKWVDKFKSGSQWSGFDLSLKKLWLYHCGVPSCSFHQVEFKSLSCEEVPSDAKNNFCLRAFSTPVEPNTLCMLRDTLVEIGSKQNKLFNIIISATPMFGTRSMYFLVWVTWDKIKTNEIFPFVKKYFQNVEQFMDRAECPPTRYGRLFS